MFQFVDDSTEPFPLEVNHTPFGVQRMADVALAMGASIEVSHNPDSRSNFILWSSLHLSEQ